MSVAGSVNIRAEGISSLQHQLRLLRMPDAVRWRLLNKLALEIRKDNIKRTRAQKDVRGHSFEAGHDKKSDKHRHKGAARKRMLVKLATKMGIPYNNTWEARLGWRNPRDGGIAYRHQMGFVQTMNKQRLEAEERDQGRTDQNRRRTLSGNKRDRINSARFAASAFAPATSAQADALAGKFWIGTKKDGTKRLASRSWIRNNMTEARAGLIIRSMHNEAFIDKAISGWTTKLPARPFLGTENTSDIKKYLQLLRMEMTRGIR